MEKVWSIFFIRQRIPIMGVLTVSIWLIIIIGFMTFFIDMY